MKNIDLQLHQFINLIIIFTIGYFTSNIYITFPFLISLLLFAFFIDNLYLYYYYKEQYHISYSSLSSAIGIVMMMVSTKEYIFFVLLLLAIFQKHFISVDSKHFFNPSNFALIIGLLFFYDKTHIVLGQLGDSLWFKYLLLIMATFILYRVDRWLISIVFVLTYILAQKFLVVSFDPVMIMDMIYDRFYSISFILFICFMLTDPKTTPNSWYMQILFGALIAVCGALLDRIYGFRVEHLFEVLFVLTPLFKVYDIENKKVSKIAIVLFILSLGAIIHIQSQPPYYFEMDL
jgi:Na+-translocating ferredoxin:NAD+ oxidoreductase RnfD subunit